MRQSASIASSVLSFIIRRPSTVVELKLATLGQQSFQKGTPSFHSLTCVPCVEISAVVDKVVPAYKGKVVFVNAIIDDDGTQALLQKFPFQYIPTSFFIDAKGNVVDSFTGVIGEASMKAYLDKLAK